MGDFRLGKTAVLGKAPVSTGFKLGMGKVPQCMFGVHINSPTGNVMALHDAYRGKEFQPNDAGLDGYPYRAEVAYNPSVGGSEGYQFLVKTYYAKDAEHGGDAENVNGTEVLDGEPTPIPKIYLNQLCRWDFGDVRFQLKGVSGTTFYTYKLIEKVDGVWALFLFKMNENPDTARTVCCYWGKQTAVDESSDAAAEAIIPNVVGAWPLDEEDREVDPIVIADDNQTTFWTVDSDEVGDIVPSNNTANKVTGTDCLELLYQNAIYTNQGVYHVYGSAQDYSSKSKVRFYFKGSNSGKPFMLAFTVGTDAATTFNGNAGFSYTFVDNFTTTRLFDLPFGAFTAENGAVAGTWALIRKVFLRANTGQASGSHSVFLDRLVVTNGVSAVDYSGNGNDGAATGTTIIDGPHAGKKCRYFSGSDVITVLHHASLLCEKELTVLIRIKPSINAARSIMAKNGWNGQFYLRQNLGYGLYADSSYAGGGVDTLERLNVMWYSSDAFALVGYTIDLNNNVQKLWVNGVEKYSEATASDKTLVQDIGNITIGAGPELDFYGYACDVAIIKGVVEGSEQLAYYNNYPDPRLIAGSIICRKWASTTLPTVASVSSMQTRKSYGKQELYPAIDNLNFTLDQANKKATMEFYLENTQTEPAGSIVIIDETAPPAWRSITAGTLAEAVVTLDTEHARYGTNVIKVSIAEGEVTEQTGFRVDLGSQQDYSTQDFICVPVWGLNNGGNVYVRIRTDDSNYGQLAIVDNWLGYKQLVIPLRTFPNTVGTLNLASIRYVEVAWNTPGTRYVDRTIVTAGVWAKVEIGIPDQLQQQYVSQYPGETYNIDKILTYVWDGSTWAQGVYYGDRNFAWDSRSKFLNGSSFRTIYGESDTYASLYSAALLNKGRMGETGRRKSLHMANETIIYSKAKTKYRIGFAIKMPPADLNASATTGIGQCKLKLEIYYV